MLCGVELPGLAPSGLFWKWCHGTNILKAKCFCWEPELLILVLVVLLARGLGLLSLCCASQALQPLWSQVECCPRAQCRQVEARSWGTAGNLFSVLVNQLLRLLCPLNHPARGFLDCHLILFVKHHLSHWRTTEIHSFINNMVEILFVLRGPAFPQSNASFLKM